MKAAGRLGWALGSVWLSLASALLTGGGYGQQQHSSCIYLTPGLQVNESKEHCFCYKMEWDLKNVWSSVRIRVQSTKAVIVSQQLDHVNCIHPENILVYSTCLLRHWWKPSASKQVSLDVGRLDQEFCFTVNPTDDSTSYTVKIENCWFNLRLFALSLTGLLLFCFAGVLSRSTAAFYVSGLVIGTAAFPLLILLILKRYLLKSGTFWLLVSICFFLMAYAVHFLKENFSLIWTDHKPYVLGYFIAVGLISFVTCYRHGSLRSDWSFQIFTCILQIIACFLIYFGLALPMIAFTIIAVLASCKCFCSLKVLHHVHRFIFRKKPVVKLLTEEEYIEQAEVETTKALEELRKFCNSSNINYWLVVSRLSSPKRFAEFILGSNHVSSAETSAHEELYGLGSCFLAEQLFTEDREELQNTDVVREENLHVEREENLHVEREENLHVEREENLHVVQEENLHMERQLNLFHQQYYNLLQ